MDSVHWDNQGKRKSSICTLNNLWEKNTIRPYTGIVTSGGMKARATVMFKCLAYLLSIKREESYVTIIEWPSFLIISSIGNYPQKKYHVMLLSQAVCF